MTAKARAALDTYSRDSIGAYVWRDIFARPYSVIYTSHSCYGDRYGDHRGNYADIEAAKDVASSLEDGEVFHRVTLKLIWERRVRRKEVTYAYPGSTLAEKAGLDPGQGAWCVMLGGVYFGDYATAEQAVAAAAARPQKWEPDMHQLTAGPLADAMRAIRPTD